jgi:hypothetical protein
MTASHANWESHVAQSFRLNGGRCGNFGRRSPGGACTGLRMAVILFWMVPMPAWFSSCASVRLRSYAVEFRLSELRATRHSCTPKSVLPSAWRCPESHHVVLAGVFGQAASFLTRCRCCGSFTRMSKFWVNLSWVAIVFLWQSFVWAVVGESFKEHFTRLKKKLLHGRKLRVSNKNNNFFGRVKLV